MNARDVVLVVADETDTTADRVCASLEAQGSVMFRFDTAEFPGRLSLDAECDGTSWRGTLCRPGDPRLDLTRVCSVYLRRPRAFEVRANLSAAERWHAATECRYGLGGVVTRLPVPYVNHPSRAADAAYKPRQLADLRVCGLTTPPTLVTNSPEAVRRFAERKGPLICKSIAASVLHTGHTAHVMYTRMLTNLEDLDGVDYAAHMFQPFVTSEYAVRLTVVGQALHAVRIDAGSCRARIDWRSDYNHLTYQIIDLPTEVRKSVLAYMKLARLNYGAWDFLIRPDGSWVALEITPEGNYSWIEEETTLNISESIARFLVTRSAWQW